MADFYYQCMGCDKTWDFHDLPASDRGSCPSCHATLLEVEDRDDEEEVLP